MWPLASKRVRRTCGSDNHRRNGVFQHNPPEAVGRELYSGKARFPQSLYTTLSMKRCGRRSDGGLMLAGRAVAGDDQHQPFARLVMQHLIAGTLCPEATDGPASDLMAYRKPRKGCHLISSVRQAPRWPLSWRWSDTGYPGFDQSPCADRSVRSDRYK